jgi:formylglycine-generating enzyme required for sulfatase activity
MTTPGPYHSGYVIDQGANAMRIRASHISAILWVITLSISTPGRADDPPKLKTQTVKVKAFSHHADAQIELIQLPPGRIALKGADGKEVQHEVKSIWMARYETRWDEYVVFTWALDIPDAARRREERRKSENGENGEYVRAESMHMSPFGHSEPWGRPADCVHFRAARKYCAWLSKATGRNFRLPTEAEWEYAARAGDSPVKLDANSLDAFAWFAGNSDNRPRPVGKKKPNPWGFCDMLGNVAEYVVRDPRDTLGLVAGGSYLDRADDVHTGARTAYSPNWQKSDPQDPKSSDWLYWDVHHVGFRVVMEE